MIELAAAAVLTGGVYEAGFARSVDDGTFDPVQFHTGLPPSVRFGPRTLTIEYGQETEEREYRVRGERIETRGTSGWTPVELRWLAGAYRGDAGKEVRIAGGRVLV